MPQPMREVWIHRLPGFHGVGRSIEWRRDDLSSQLKLLEVGLDCRLREHAYFVGTLMVTSVPSGVVGNHGSAQVAYSTPPWSLLQ